MSVEHSEDQEEQFQPIATFILKTYAILNQPENAQAICWQPEGNCFIIKNINNLTQKVLPHHFRHHKYESFIRQLNMYSFNKVKSAEGPCFANPFFQRDREDLLRFIKRKPEKKKKKILESLHLAEKEKTIKMINDQNCPPTTTGKITLEEELNQPLKEEPQKPIEVPRKVQFAEEAAENCEDRLSIIMEPSCKWLTNKEESVWLNIKSYKSFKISMKLLGLEQEGQVADEKDQGSPRPKTTESGLVTLKHLDSN